MRRLFLTGFGLVMALYLLPIFLSYGGDKYVKKTDAVPVQNATGSGVSASTPLSGTAPADGSPQGTDFGTVIVSIDGTPVELPLEDYVQGVVTAEAPEDFPIEALRAQAVAARTYAVYKMSRGRPDEHPDADLCDDFNHCAAYRPPAVATADGDGGVSNIAQAVNDTKGIILTYEGSPVAAVFHCASGPRTESALDVWGENVPYLQSVVSPGGSSCDKYEGTVTISAKDFREKVGEAFPSANVSGPPETWFTSSNRTAGGAIKTVQLGDVEVEGTALRELFGLNSTNFTITTRNDKISFHTIGYGHCVGLSQYGARYMAEQGASFEEILKHYYTGCEINAESGAQNSKSGE